MVKKNYFQKKMIKKSIFFILTFIMTCNVCAMDNKVPFAASDTIVRSGIGTCMAGLGLAALISDTNPTVWSTSMTMGCILISLHKFLSDVPIIKGSLHKITVPLLGACLVALRTRDANRSVCDHIRALSIGALLTAGVAQLAKRIFYQGGEYDAYAWGLLAGGALLLSQKDVKRLLGLQKGYSLNPPLEVKKLIEKSPEKKLNIDRVVAQCAEVGRMQSLPFIMRLGACIRPRYEDQTPSVCSITEFDFVTTILPYLRTETMPEEIKSNNQSQLVFSTDLNKNVAMSAGLIKKFLSPEAYLNS